jgi:hypothetical protein
MRKALFLLYVFSILLIFLGLGCLSFEKRVEEPVVGEKKGNPVSSTTPVACKFGEEEFSQVFPRYRFLGARPLFDGTVVVAFGLEVRREYQGKIHLAVFKSDTTGTWEVSWELPRPVNTDVWENTAADGASNHYVQQLVLQDQDVALNICCLGTQANHPHTTLVAFTVNRDGKTKLQRYNLGRINFFIQEPFVRKGGVIELAWGNAGGGSGQYRFSLEHGEYFEEWIPASRYKPRGSVVEAKFLLGSEWTGTTIIPAESPVLEAKVGETVVFTPSSPEAAEELDKGSISIYTDAWNGPPVTPCMANMLIGNCYTFDKPGEVHFLLLSDDELEKAMGESVVESTFTVIVKP